MPCTCMQRALLTSCSRMPAPIPIHKPRATPCTHVLRALQHCGCAALQEAGARKGPTAWVVCARNAHSCWCEHLDGRTRTYTPSRRVPEGGLLKIPLSLGTVHLKHMLMSSWGGILNCSGASFLFLAVPFKPFGTSTCWGVLRCPTASLTTLFIHETFGTPACSASPLTTSTCWAWCGSSASTSRLPR